MDVGVHLTLRQEWYGGKTQVANSAFKKNLI